jgi:hypothetical protein
MVAMLDKYILWHESNTDPIGLLKVETEGMEFSFERNGGYKGPLPFFLWEEEFALPFNEVLKRWVFGRAPDPNYEFIAYLIKKAGLKKYDPYGFFKCNNGRYVSDGFFVESLDEERRLDSVSPEAATKS